eukprot:gnl/MRDRNA2_/MRDRNA2_86216_c0_seq6.p1 gnl/MRDRNA2_/MRDRNA2_86216_c0~~gnl/MRDRNA2_/MRDRNA2_86216_c0_seq6.p1  ORF type:complete len:242 (+),score=38.00 gnl/MRDRNA2_/MRDRNA2_86216_c0_seq6:108-833(+)
MASHTDDYGSRSMRARLCMSSVDSIAGAMAKTVADELAFDLASWPEDADVAPDVPDFIAFDKAPVGLEESTFTCAQMHEVSNSRLEEMLEAQHEDLQSIRRQLWRHAHDGVNALLREASRPMAFREPKNATSQLPPLFSDKHSSSDAFLPPLNLQVPTPSGDFQSSMLHIPFSVQRHGSNTGRSSLTLNSGRLPEIEEPNMPRNATLRKLFITCFSAEGYCELESEDLKSPCMRRNAALRN